MIEVIRPGQFSTIQDLGRYGFRAMGVPVSGPMDRSSAKFANHLLGNEANAPVIEMSFVGASFLFHKAAVIAVFGADCQISMNNVVIESKHVFKIEANSTVKFGAITSGNFLYLAISGGFLSETVLGSTSYFGGLTENSQLIKGQRLRFDETIQNVKPNSLKITKTASEKAFIYVEKGPEFNQLSKETIQQLLKTEFTISPQSNRMGFRINENAGFGMKDIISSPVQAGTVQLTQGGQLIVLMRDAQTIGGYSRVLQITTESIDRLAQKRFGEQFRFRLIDDFITL